MQATPNVLPSPPLRGARPARARRRGWRFVALVIGIVLPVSASSAADNGEPSFDGLEPVPNAKVAKAYIDPTADFSVYRRVKILHPYVAFRSHWKRDQNADRTRRLTARDVDRFKKDIADLFEKVFTEVLDEENGHTVTQENAPDVLLLRPAIIDIDVTVPDNQDDARATTYTTSTGAATLYVELYDSVSGQIIGRAIDRRSVRQPGSSIEFTNRATLHRDGRQLFRRWATLLRDFLERHYKGSDRSD